ncbi:hypothetical protein [Streptomyces synnematoformans]|uniref:Bile acid:sodium symporter n=1 Tax=Streptomyces synnematoformans TaxID=415721 RepID=A0ABN2XE23_9ACTN
MKTAFLLGAFLGLLLVYPDTLGAPIATAALQLLAQPFVVAFLVGVLARPALTRRLRRWTP